MNASLVQCNFDYLAYSNDNTKDEAETEAEARTSSLSTQYFGCHHCS